MIPELHTRFDAAVTAALDGATVVTVTTRATRMLLAEAIRRLRANSGACRTPDILPLEALYRRLWEEALVAGAASEALLSSGRAYALWRKVISHSRRSGNLLTTHGSARMAQDAWRIMQEYRITLDERAVRGIPECEAFFEWSSLYKEECRRGSWIDASALPEALAGRLDQIAAVPKRLAVYGFDDLTPQASAFCDALKAGGTQLEVISTRVSPESGTARVVSAEAFEDELRLAAAWARQKLITSTSQHIGIVVPRLRDQRDAVEAAFAEVLHPEEFLSPAPNPNRAFEIAAGRPLDDYPMVKHALLLLRFTFGEVAIHDLGIVLRSPYIGDASEASARAMFDVALRKNGRSQYSAGSLRKVISGGPQNLRVPDKLLRMIRQVANLSPPPSKLLRPSEAADMFNDALVNADWPSREPDSGEYQLGERWDNLLGDFASLDGFLAPQGAAAMVEELARMAASVSFRPKNSGAPVQIMDEDEAAGCAFDALWLCGLSDDWPQTQRLTPYLPLALQRAAGVPNLAPGEQHAAAAATLAQLTAAACDVVLSWPRHDHERQFRPNRLLSQFMTAAAGEVCGTLPPTCASLQLAMAALEYLDDRIAPAADPENLPHRGTDVLKYQAHCPFRAFAQLRLGAQPLESPELGLDRRVRGGLVETALEVFWQHVRDSVNLRDLTPSQRLNEILDDSVAKAFAKCWPEAPRAWDERLRAIEKRRLHALLRQWCDVELKRHADFDVMIAEQQQDIDVALGPIKIRARIDRVDRVRGGGFVVIDYKSGAEPKPATWTSARPEEPQLPLYAVHQLALGREVDGVAFAHVTTVKPSWKGYSNPLTVLGIRDNFKRHLNGSTWQQFIRGWKVTLENLAKNFVAGESTVDPKHLPGSNNSSCRYCHLQSVCRVAEVKFAAANDDEPGGDDE